MTLVLKVNCRACNRECGDYKHLMDETLIDDEATTLAALLNYCTTLDCFDGNEDFSLPEHICNSCVEHLLQSYLFKEMVLQNDRDLRERIKREIEESQSNLEIDQVIQETDDAGSEMAVSEIKQCDDFVEQDIDVGEAEEENLKGFPPEEKVAVEKQKQTTTIKEEKHLVKEIDPEPLPEKMKAHELVEEEHNEDERDDVVEYEMVEWLEIDEESTTPTDERPESSQQDVEEQHFIKIEGNGGEGEEFLVAEDEEHFESADSIDDSKDYEKENGIDQQGEKDAEEDDAKKITRKKFVKSGGLTEEDLKCQYCGKQFDKMCRLREHTYVHTGEKPHVCQICGKRSRTKTHYNVHMLTHSEEKKYRCDICGQHYRTSTSLRVHERKHSDIRPYACPICDKSFHTAEQKKLHVMIHTGERPYKCDICDKAYRESHSLKQHLLTHGDKKPFQCDVCGKGLTQMSGYRRHMLLHTNEYPYSCDICGRPFRISSNLVAHKRLHFNNLPYQCTVCSKGFNNSTRLKKHMLQHEKESTKESFKPRKQRQEPIIVDTKMCKSRVVEII
ncbi:uncharacterized protein [Musca autumnalis]|uniref:uncharacterized protein n=1 Tax=Musca autumnalis TaxID=221902 RepID=UPI003CF1422B